MSKSIQGVGYHGNLDYSIEVDMLVLLGKHAQEEAKSEYIPLMSYLDSDPFSATLRCTSVQRTQVIVSRVTFHLRIALSSLSACILAQSDAAECFRCYRNVPRAKLQERNH
jgi:hypothetical protein